MTGSFRKLLCLAVVVTPTLLLAEEEKVFQEDKKDFKKREQSQISQVVRSPVTNRGELKFDAPNISYDREAKKVKGEGGVLLSYEGVTAQADSGAVDMESKDSELEGDVFFAWPGGAVGCEKATVNLENETGEFTNGQAIWEEGQYKVSAEKLNKLSEFDYRFDDAAFTTCHCADDSCPWSIRADRLDARQEGYGVAHGAWFEMFGVPVVYTPYAIFPIKNERQSGLLAPTYGYSSKDGLKFSIPFFGVIDDQTDITLEPFIETHTRRGTSLETRKVFSKQSSFTGKFYYSDESPRDGNLRGTNTEGLFDPTFDEDRYAVYVKQSWRNEKGSDIPLSLNTKVRYVSDDLFLREIDASEIGDYNQRYTTSTMVGSAAVGDYLNGSISTEYNQALISDDDDLLFQRLPELNLATRRNFKPFGSNPYGLKLQSGVKTNYTQFYREKGYDGGRFDVNPTLQIPYHFKNYFNGAFGSGFHYTGYNMDNTAVPNSDAVIEGNKDRHIATLNYSIGTGVERVYELDQDGFLASLTSLGSENKDRKLRRVKHTIEPTVVYQYVPKTYQDDLPLYDSMDRMRHKSVFTYALKNALYGRYIPSNVAGEVIPEISPEIEDLPRIDTESALPELDQVQDFDVGFTRTPLRTGEIREIMSFTVKQSYDYVKDQKEGEDPFSDIGMSYLFDPTPSLGFNIDANMDHENRDFSSWDIGSRFRDDRGDIFRLDYNFVDDYVSQITAGVETPIVDQLKVGFYGRYNEREHEFQESISSLRYKSSCDCWYLDLGYKEKINPDKSEVFLTLTFRGLGALRQGFGLDDDD